MAKRSTHDHDWSRSCGGLWPILGIPPILSIVSYRDRSDLTVLVPCFDAGPHLSPLLDSLCQQTERGVRIVVVDDCSTDDSVAIARSHAGVEVVQNERRLGIGGNWNRCASLVDTDYFALAHMDDVYEPQWASRSLERLRADVSAGAVHSRARAIDADGKFLDSPRERYKLRAWRRAAAGGRAETYRRLLESNFVIAPSVVWRTSAFRASGGFDETLKFALDWKALFALLLSGHDLASIDAPMVRYRRHARSATSRLEDPTRRVREEIEVATFARERGVAAGWLSAGAGFSTAPRDLAFVDVIEDLRAGQIASARERVRYLRDESGVYRRDGLVRVVQALLAAGPAGRWSLRAAFRVFVALRAPRDLRESAREPT